MLKRVLPLAVLLLVAACGQSSLEQAATTPTATFRTDTDLVPLPLDALLASASDAGSQYAELTTELGPDGPVSGIFAHAPTNMVTAISSTSRELVVDFGLREAAYTGDAATKGVCFVVSGGAALDQLTELWRRCLTPVEVEADRGMQEASIELPAGTALLRFSTSAAVAQDTNFGWSYWGNPRVH